MYRFTNFLLLIQVSIPFLHINLAYKRLKKGNGHLYRFWRNVEKKLPTLTHLDGALRRRIFHYLFANSLTTQWFATLLGHKPSREEKETGYYVAIATPIADFLVDREKINVARIYEMLEKKSDHAWQKMAYKLLTYSMKHHPNPGVGKKLIYLTLEAQEESLEQHAKKLGLDKLKSITWKKGGNALLLYRSILQTKISTPEWNAVYQLGGLMQLHNDIFDLYRDMQEGITTIPSSVTSIADLKSIFTQEIEQTYTLFNQLPYSISQRRKFFLLLYLAVHTGYQALDQYAELEKKYGSFTPETLTRKELVCDMDHLFKIGKTVWATINKKHI